MPAVMVLVFLVSLLAGCTSYRNHESQVQSKPTPVIEHVTLHAADVDAWFASTASWRMPEQAFQYVGDLVVRYGLHSQVHAAPDAITALRSRLRGAFPNAALVSADLIGNQLTVAFDGKQNCTVPTSMGQVGVSMGQQVTFQVEMIPEDQLSVPEFAATQPTVPGAATAPTFAPATDRHGIRMRVISGGLRINFTWIRRLLSRSELPDLQADSLSIEYVPSLHVGKLSALQEYHLPGPVLTWQDDGHRLMVDLHHPDLPWHDAVQVTSMACTFLGQPIWKRTRPFFRWHGASVPSPARSAGGTDAPSSVGLVTPEVEGPDPPPGVHAEPMLVYHVTRNGRPTTTMRLQQGDAVMSTSPYPREHIDACGLTGARADALLADPASVLRQGLDAKFIVFCSFENDMPPVVDAEVALRFLGMPIPNP